MTDLERLITERQDQLRGRREDWLDRFRHWRERTDPVGVAMIVGAVVIAALLLWFAP
jgi:hypothetical protein